VRVGVPKEIKVQEHRVGLVQATVRELAAHGHAVLVERGAGGPLMSGFHAFYSVGSLAGAVGAAGLLTLGLPVPGMALAVSALGLAVLLWAGRWWRRDRAPAGEAVFAWPRGVVLVIGTVCFVAFLAEGAMLDWSAVFLHEVRGVDVVRAGWGFVAFNVAMTGARLAGDRTIAWLGRRWTLVASAVVGCGGMLLATLAAPPWLAMAGCAVLGLGCANVVPIVFSLAGEQRRMPVGLAIPAVTTMGYAGVLLGPALIGFIAQGLSLAIALACAGVALGIAAMAGAHAASRGLR